MSSRSRVNHKRFRITYIGQMRGQFNSFNKSTACLAPAAPWASAPILRVNLLPPPCGALKGSLTPSPPARAPTPAASLAFAIAATGSKETAVSLLVVVVVVAVVVAATTVTELLTVVVAPMLRLLLLLLLLLLVLLLSESTVKALSCGSEGGLSEAAMTFSTCTSSSEIRPKSRQTIPIHGCPKSGEKINCFHPCNTS